jgi:hypothetical protein
LADFGHDMALYSESVHLQMTGLEDELEKKSTAEDVRDGNVNCFLYKAKYMANQPLISKRPHILCHMTFAVHESHFS